MKPEHWIAIGSAVLTAILTAIGLYVGPKLAVKRSLEQFRSQKWWERQQEVYTQLLEDLSIIYSHDLDVMDQIETENNYKLTTEISGMITSARHRVERLSVTGAYMISEAAACALTKYQRASYRADAESHPHAACDIESSAAKECLEIIKQEAKKALS